MISRTTGKFWECYKKLPKEIKKKAKEAFRNFQEDPFYPSLHFKKIHPQKSIFSIRITKDYRALGVLEKNEIVWFWIGNHEDYEKFIKKLTIN